MTFGVLLPQMENLERKNISLELSLDSPSKNLHFPTKPFTQKCGNCLHQPGHFMYLQQKKKKDLFVQQYMSCILEKMSFLVYKLVLADKLYQSSPASKYRPNFLSAPLAIYSCVSTTALSSQQPQMRRLCF